MLNRSLFSSKRAQVAIFIILAILIVVGVGIYFAVKSGVFQPGIPQDFEPVYDYYLSCVEESAYNGAYVLGQQAGYLSPPEFVSGSEHMPFSSELNFLGVGIPYWYYISGNGVAKEQIPSKGEMQNQLEEYVEERLLKCDFSDFEAKGFEIVIEEAEVSSTLKDNSVSVNVKQDLSISKGEVSWRKTSHSASVNSRIGKLYDLAKKIYSNEKQTMFLENYGVDVLRLYAPVDGTEIGCSPKIWSVNEVGWDLVQALETNVPAIKIKGDYYGLANEQNKYFVQDLGSDVPDNINVNFLYSRNWPMRMEVWPSEDGLMIAEPVGLQQGMGMMGFCYVPYHFVYDFTYPVLIQLYSGDEMFQFPVVVYINKNQPREAVVGEGLEKEIELCKYKNQDTTVYTYNSDLEPVEARIIFECLGEKCDLGWTEISGNGTGSSAVLKTAFPQCVNGFVLAKADGYDDKRVMHSSNQPGTADIIFDRLYDLDVELKINSATTSDLAVVSFVSDDKSKTIAWPETKTVQLTEGEYDVSVYVYSSSSINIPSTSTQKCVEVPKPGISGIFGGTEEKCYDFEIPGQVVSNAISAGGKVSEYFVESQLETGKIKLNVDGLKKPGSLEDLQRNYELLDAQSVYIDFG